MEEYSSEGLLQEYVLMMMMEINNFQSCKTYKIVSVNDSLLFYCPIHWISALFNLSLVIINYLKLANFAAITLVPITGMHSIILSRLQAIWQIGAKNYDILLIDIGLDSTLAVG